MREDTFKDYKHERYIHYRLVDTGEYKITERKKDGEVIKMKMPVTKKMKVDFEEVKNISLDKYGVHMPTYEADFTIIHNYLYDFWQPVLGSEAVACYTLLKRYCYGKKDYCYPDMDTICFKLKKSRNTVVKYLETLEQFGFIIRIWRKDKQRNNSDASPIFKIRRYIPMLSEDLINNLPESIKEEHDRYLADIQGISLDETTDASQVVESIISKSEEFMSKADKDFLNEVKEAKKTREFIVSSLTDEQKFMWKQILQEVEKRVSKPSFETWFKDTVFVVNDDSATILSPNSFNANWIRDRHHDLIKEILFENFGIDLQTVHVDIYGKFI